MSRFADARAPLEKALQRWPDLFQLNSLYEFVLLKLGELDRSYEILSHTRQLNPEDASTRDSLYSTAMGLADRDGHDHKFADALCYLNEAVKLRPQESQPHLALAEIYKQMGEGDRAAQEQREADRLSAK